MKEKSCITRHYTIYFCDFLDDGCAILKTIAGTTPTKTRKFAPGVTENVPNPNSDAPTTSAFPLGGVAITTTIAETAATRSAAKLTLVLLANSNANPDIASKKSSSAMASATVSTSAMNSVADLDSQTEAIAPLKNSNVEITFVSVKVTSVMALMTVVTDRTRTPNCARALRATVCTSSNVTTSNAFRGTMCAMARTTVETAQTKIT